MICFFFSSKHRLEMRALLNRMLSKCNLRLLTNQTDRNNNASILVKLIEMKRGHESGEVYKSENMDENEMEATGEGRAGEANQRELNVVENRIDFSKLDEITQI